MVFVHFTPKKNVQDIKRNGIRPDRRSRVVFLFPLLYRDMKTLTNQWDQPHYWRHGTARHDKATAKIIVKLPDSVRISFGDWVHSMGIKGKSDLLLFTVSELGRVLAGLLRNPYTNAAVPRGGRAEDRSLLIEFANWCKKNGRYYAGYSSALEDLEFWLKNRMWETDKNVAPLSYGADLWGSEVVYPGRIPPKWIVKIFDRSNTDVRTRAYSRHSWKTAD